jgi:hypothetical protein
MATTNKNDKDTKKSSKPSQSEQDNNKRKSEALKKIVEHNRDYLKLDLTLPLGDTALKQVHTNQWLFTDLPAEFDLANWTIIAKQLNSNVNRWEGYVENRWYIESCDISVDESKAEMKLGLNAFASNFNSYSDTFKAFEKAYTDATNKATTSTTKTSASKSTTNAVTTGENKTVKNGWWGEWVTKTVKSVVGNETDTLKKCKKMHEYFRWKTRWTEYYDMKYTGGSVKNLEKQWYRHKFNCGDGANYLSAFYACCGASTGIYLGPGHYVVKCVVNGKTYWCDHSGPEGGYNKLRGFGQTYHNIRGGNAYGRYV